MPKADSSFSMLVVAAGLALGIGYYVPQTLSQKPAHHGADLTGRAYNTYTHPGNANGVPSRRSDGFR